jgi:hypothetical protein
MCWQSTWHTYTHTCIHTYDAYNHAAGERGKPHGVKQRSGNDSLLSGISMCMYVCMACMYVCMYARHVCMYICSVCMYVCSVCMCDMSVCLCTYACMCLYAWMVECMHVFVSYACLCVSSVSTYVCTRVRANVCMHVCSMTYQDETRKLYTFMKRNTSQICAYNVRRDMQTFPHISICKRFHTVTYANVSTH